MHQSIPICLISESFADFTIQHQSLGILILNVAGNKLSCFLVVNGLRPGLIGILTLWIKYFLENKKWPYCQKN